MEIAAMDGRCQNFHCNPVDSVVVFNNVMNILIPEVSVPQSNFGLACLLNIKNLHE
jgi:hypothetical protein